MISTFFSEPLSTLCVSVRLFVQSDSRNHHNAENSEGGKCCRQNSLITIIPPGMYMNPKFGVLCVPK